MACGVLFPDQGLNLHLLPWMGSLNHWATKGVPIKFLKNQLNAKFCKNHIKTSLPDLPGSEQDRRKTLPL